MHYPRISLKKFILTTGVIVSIFVAKQYLLFGIAGTSSFVGLNLCQSIGACQNHHIDMSTLGNLHQKPNVLIREQKLTGAHNFNHLIDLELNQAYLQDYKRRISVIHVSQLLKAYWKNALIYFQPSSNYASTNMLLMSLPQRWRLLYERIFSAPMLPIALLVSAIFWLSNHSKKEWGRAAGLFLPILTIFAISIFFESGENMRFKFFIEPVLFIFVAAQFYGFGTWLFQILYRIFGRLKSYSL